MKTYHGFMPCQACIVTAKKKEIEVMRSYWENHSISTVSPSPPKCYLSHSLITKKKYKYHSQICLGLSFFFFGFVQNTDCNILTEGKQK